MLSSLLPPANVTVFNEELCLNAPLSKNFTLDGISMPVRPDTEKALLAMLSSVLLLAKVAVFSEEHPLKA